MVKEYHVQNMNGKKNYNQGANLILVGFQGDFISTVYSPNLLVSKQVLLLVPHPENQGIIRML